ncbi:polysaccharide deacetylase family protein [Roseateles flavus]|uniref:Polysaccharide deacetylase family protein n=1 Tax=Roseateles flavus TaxID=3149041 RepID=A0ABV0GA76_9BURK
MIRSLLLTAVAALAALASSALAQAPQRIALTMDDGPHLSATPRLSPQARNEAILAALRKHRVQAALFVTCGNGADRPEGLALVQAWSQAGQLLGNHTMTHLDLNSPQVSLEQCQDEIQRCQQILAGRAGLQRWFRFTFLREGKPEAKRDGMRAWLKAQGIRNAYVSLDTSDWRLNEFLETRLKADPQADVGDIRQAYLDHLWQRAQAYQALSRRLQGRDIAQVLLTHHNLLNALFLDDVIAMFKARGWQFISPAEAFEDPVYQLQPLSNVAGQSLLLSMARSLGLGRFEGWERLVDDGDYEIERLSKPDAAAR